MNIKKDTNEIRIKLGQMFMMRGLNIFRNETYKLIECGFAGGVQIKGNNTQSEIREAQKISPELLFIAADLENGFTGGNFDGTPMPCQMALGAIGSESIAYEWAAVTAREARKFGVNFVFGPVVDMANEPSHPYANIRCSSSDKNEVVKIGTAIIKGYQDNGMQVSAKHYPGAGRFDNDNHIEPIVLKCNEKTFLNEEIFIYEKLFSQCKLNGIMSGHIAVDAIDGKKPATISKKIISYLDNLGFNGLLITDSLAMKGIASDYSLENVIIGALNAGHDLILGDYNISPEVQLEFMYKAFIEGKFSKKRIDHSYEKILRAKKNINAIPPCKFDKKKHAKIAFDINRRSITITGDNNKIADAGKMDTLFIVAKENMTTTTSQEITANIAEIDFITILKSKFPMAGIIQITDNPTPSKIEETINTSLHYKSIIFIGYAMIDSYKGTADFPRTLLAMVKGLKKKIKVFILIGNPFAARELPELPCVIYGYEGASAEIAVIEVLTGAFKPSGKLPVRF